MGELHLNAVVWGVKIPPGEKTIKDPQEMLAVLGFDSVTSYVWLHHQPLPTFPRTPYADVRDASVKDAEKFIGMYKVPYYPNVTMGWDPSPRTIQSDVYEDLGYPFTPVLEGNTPEAYRQGLSDFKMLIDRTPKHPKIVTLNAWNEWTEGSYLEPDTIHGLVSRSDPGAFGRTSSRRIVRLR